MFHRDLHVPSQVLTKSWALWAAKASRAAPVSGGDAEKTDALSRKQGLGLSGSWLACSPDKGVEAWTEDSV